MGQSSDQPISLGELDARHDEVLCRLEELDQRIQAVLREYLPQKAAASLASSSCLDATSFLPDCAEKQARPLLFTCGDPSVPTC